MTAATRQRTQVAIVGAGPAGLAARRAARAGRRRGGGARAPAARVRRAAPARGHPRAGHGRPARRGRRRRADAPRGLLARRHRAALRRTRGTGSTSSRSWAGGVVVCGRRPRSSRTSIAARLATGAPLRVRGRRRRGARPRRASAAGHVPRTTGRDGELRCDVVAGCDGFHGVCRDADPGRRARRRDARLPLRLARHPRRASPPSCDELIYAQPRARLRAAQHAHARDQPRCTCSASPTTTSPTWPDERIWEELHQRLALGDWSLAGGADLRQGDHGDALLRRRADAARAPVPRRRRRPHRPADRRQGAEPRRRRRRRARRGARRRSATGDGVGSSATPRRCSRRVWRAEHFSVVDDLDAAQPARRRSLRPAAAARQLRVRVRVARGGGVAGGELRRGCPGDGPGGEPARRGDLAGLRGAGRAAQRRVGRLLVHGASTPRASAAATTAEQNRAEKEERVREGRAHAALVYDGDDLRRLVPVRTDRRAAADQAPARLRATASTALPDWRITCFFVDSGHRRRGVAAAALGGALEEIARLGGGTVESYPEDIDGRKVSRLVPAQRHRLAVRAPRVRAHAPDRQAPLGRDAGGGVRGSIRRPRPLEPA